MSQLQDERAELAEDEEKLQIALQEYNNAWLSEEDDDDDEEDHLLIDLEKPISTSDFTGRSTSPSLAECGSQIVNANVPDEDNGDVPTAPDLPSVSSQEVTASDAEKTLALNRALQGILEKHMEDVRYALEENKHKQQLLDDGNWDEESARKRRGRTFGPFRTPYFKDGCSLPPENEDVKLKKRSGELSFEDMHERLHLTGRTRENLMDGILDDLREQLIRPLLTRLEIEIKKAKECDVAIDLTQASVMQAEDQLKKLTSKTHLKKSTVNDAKVKKLKGEIKHHQKKLTENKKKKDDQNEIIAAIEEQMERMKKTDEKSLLAGFNVDSVDWMKISKMRFGEKTSWIDCKKLWEHMINPSLNQGQWTKGEEKHLKELVRKYPAGKWDQIAEELGTKRTPFMCFHQFQRCHNPAFKSRLWTEEEDRHLVAITNRVKEGAAFFSWRKVSSLVESRSSLECMNRFSRLDERTKRGKWTKEEDARLLAAVEILGTSWSKISKHMGQRMASQCRDRYIQCLDPRINFSIFTYDEDVKLLRLHKSGMSWSKMTSHFQGRTDNLLHCRYNTLQKWKREAEWWEKQKPETQNMLLGKHLKPSERKLYEGKSKNSSIRLGIGDNDHERQKLDRQNGVTPDLIPPRPKVHLKYSKFSRLKRAMHMERWTNKLAFHQQLTEKLKSLVAKEQMKFLAPKKGQRKKIETDEEREVIGKLITNAATETLKNYEVITKQKYQEMNSVLNRYFLGDSNVSVKDLLLSCKEVKKRGRRKRTTRGIQVNSELSDVLRSNKSLFSKGRVRKLVPRDGRSGPKIETEREDVKKTIAVLMLESLSPGFSSFHNMVKHRSLDTEEERLKLASFMEDEDYINRVAFVERRISEVNSIPFFDPYKKGKEIAKLKKVLSSLDKIFQSHYAEKRKKFEMILGEINEDLEYVDVLQKSQQELFAVYLPGILMDTPSPTAAIKLLSSPNTSAAFAAFSQLSQNVEKEKTKVDDALEKKKSLRPSSLRKRKQPTSEQIHGSTKLPRYDSLECLNSDREKIPPLDMSPLIQLPYLPPTHHTLNGLRALLLNRQQLTKTAGKLYSVENYRKKNMPQYEVVVSGHQATGTGLSVPSIEKDSGKNAPRDGGSTGTIPRCSTEFDNNQRERDIHPQNLDPQQVGNMQTSLSFTTTSNISSPYAASSTSGQELKKKYLYDTEFTDVKLPENVIERMLPAPKTLSSYEVSYGVMAQNRCRDHVLKTETKLLPIEEALQSSKPSTTVIKIVRVPRITHKQAPVLLAPGVHGRSFGRTPKVKDKAKESDSFVSEVDDIMEEVYLRAINEKEIGTDLIADSTCTRVVGKKVPRVQTVDNVVVVGIDPKSKKVVHYKPNEKADDFESVQSTPQEECSEKAGECPRESDKAIGEEDKDKKSIPNLSVKPKTETPPATADAINPNVIHTIRQTDEYKAFASRLHSLFMWPVLMSTCQPPGLPRPTPEQIAAKPKREPSGKRRFLTKELRREREKIKLAKREARRVAKEAALSGGQEINASVNNDVTDKRKKRKRLLPLPAEPKIERPVRKVRIKPEAIKSRLEQPVAITRLIPSWWKDAILEAMLTKQAIDRGEISRDEKNLSEEEDFQDKGNYSDDDGWLAPLLEQERKEKEKKRKEEEKERKRREEQIEEEEEDFQGNSLYEPKLVEKEESKKSRQEEITDDDDDIEGNKEKSIEEPNKSQAETDRREEMEMDEENIEENNQEPLQENSDYRGTDASSEM